MTMNLFASLNRLSPHRLLPGVWVRIPLATVILLASSTAPVFALEIKGRVAGVSGDEITIQIEGEMAPNLGEVATIHVDHATLGHMTVGTWEVIAVKQRMVTARRRQSTGAPKTGMAAVIESTKPVPLARPAEKILRPAPVRSPADRSLIEAAEKGDLAGVKKALVEGANVNAGIDGSQTALMTAALAGHRGIVQTLLDGGANPNVEAQHLGQTALAMAASGGHDEIVKLLLDRGASINHRSGKYKRPYAGVTALFIAALRNRVSTIDLLIKSGADPNIENDDGLTPLMYAAAKGLVDALNALIHAGAPVDYVSSTGVTALLSATDAQAKWQMIAYLASAGADPNARVGPGKNFPKEFIGATPLMLAALDTDPSSAFVLLMAGADVSVKSLSGMTAAGNVAKKLREDAAGGRSREELELLQKALSEPVSARRRAMEFIADKIDREIRENNLVAVAAVLSIGLDPNTKVDGEPLLHRAIRTGNPAIVGVLLEKGADPNAKNRESATALGLACRQSNADIFKRLLAARADPKIRDEKGNTLLHCVSESGDEGVELSRALLAAGADVNAKGEDDKTPLYLAARSGAARTFRLYLSSGARIDSANRSDLFDAAIRGGSAEVAGLVLPHLDRGALRNDSNRLFQAATGQKNSSALRLLVSAGLDINARGGRDNQTVLQSLTAQAAPRLSAAVTGDRVETRWSRRIEVAALRELISLGANPNLADRNGETALHTAVWQGDLEMARMFLSSGADPNARTNKGQTPLHYAAGRAREADYRPKVEMFQLLISSGANPEIRDKDGHAAIAYAPRDLQPTFQRAIRDARR